MNDTQSLIKQRLSSMPNAEKKIAAFILDDTLRAVGMTMRTLAGTVGVSEGSVSNFALRLGFDGFSALKLSLARGLSEGGNLKYSSVQSGDSAKEIMRKMRDNSADALTSTFETMSEETLNRAVEMLTGAKRRIEVYGLGSSSMLANDATFRFIRLGLPAVAVSDNFICTASALMLGSDCLALAISYTGRTHDILKTMSIAKEKGAKTMCITCYADSPLAKLCDLSLIAVSGESVVNKLATVSRLAQLLVVDTLCEIIASQRRDDAAEKQSEIIGAWNEYWVQNK